MKFSSLCCPRFRITVEPPQIGRGENDLWTDNETWKAYNVEAWPTFFLLDKQGRIRWMHVGEGHYDEAERQIQKLLAEKES